MATFCRACGIEVDSRAVICPSCGVAQHARPDQARPVLALVLNLLLPGVGTILLGQVSIGVLQLVLQVVAWALDFTVILTPFGIVLGFSVWVWALVISIRAFSAGSRAA